MPITPSAYQPLPFVRSGRQAELALRRGEMEADATRRRGEMSANMWSNLGNSIAGTIGGILKDRQEAPARAQAEQLRGLQIRGAQQNVEAGDRAVATEAAGRQTKSAINALLGRARKQDPVSGAWTYDRDIIGQGLTDSGMSDQWLTVAPLLDQSDAAVQKLRGSQTEAIKSVAALVAATGNDPDVFESELGRGIANGLFTEQAVTSYRHAAQRDPKSIANITRGILGQAPPALIQRDPTKPLVNPQTGEEVLPGVAAPKPPETRSLEVQLAEAFRNGDSDAASAIQRAMRAGRVPEKAAKPTYEWAFDPKSGKNVYVTADEIRSGGMQKPTGSQRSASGVEKRAMGFFNRARQADIDLEGLEAEIQKMGLGEQAYMAAAPNFMQTETGQQYTQAQRAFTEARLRKDSGAAIPKEEFANDRVTYFAQPGDTKATLEQKRRARAAVLASLGSEAGQALAEFEGDGDAATALVQGYKTRAAKPGATPAEGTRGTVNGKPAIWKTVNGKAGWYEFN